MISKATACRYRRKLLDLANHIPPPKRGSKSWHGHRWSKRLEELVLTLRLAHETYGKKKITILLARDYQIKTSESTVGRILKYLMDRLYLPKLPPIRREKHCYSLSKKPRFQLNQSR